MSALGEARPQTAGLPNALLRNRRISPQAVFSVRDTPP